MVRQCLEEYDGDARVADMMEDFAEAHSVKGWRRSQRKLQRRSMK